MKNGAALPSIAEIRASKEILSAADSTTKVVRIRGSMVAKYGLQVSLLEAENMKYVAENSNVPVPTLLGTLTEPATGCNFIVMEFVPGQTLERAWPELTSTEKIELERLLRAALNQLRQLADPGYLGSVGGQAFADGIFWKPDGSDATISGPFKSESAMNKGILLRLAETQPAPHVALLRTIIASTLYGHRTYFTHGDLQPKNIIVQRRASTRNDDSRNGSSILDINIIDWEISGWYPEYWEFCNSTIAGDHRPYWLDLTQKIMPVYKHEYLMMQTVRKIILF